MEGTHLSLLIDHENDDFSRGHLCSPSTAWPGRCDPRSSGGPADGGPAAQPSPVRSGPAVRAGTVGGQQLPALGSGAPGAPAFPAGDAAAADPHGPAALRVPSAQG